MQDKFIEAFKEALELENEVHLSDKFRDYDEWDSLARLSLIAMLDDEYELQIENEEFEKIITVGELYHVIEATQD
jgi:acyl carrier protein